MITALRELWFFPRAAVGSSPAGITVSKTATLPAGDFRIDEYVWPGVVLWFVAEQEFTADEREDAYRIWSHRRSNP